MLETVPDAQPAVAPNNEEFQQMLAALMAMEPEAPPVAAT